MSEVTKLALLPTAAIMANINRLGKRLDGLDQEVHATALQCLLHAQEHGDVMLADRLVKTLGGKNTQKAIDAAIKGAHEPFEMGRHTGYNVRGLVMWFLRYTPIVWNGDGKPGLLKAGMKTHESLLSRNDGLAWNVEAARLNPFWTLDEVIRDQERPAFTLESVATIVHNLRDRLDKAVKEGKFKGDPDAAYAYINALGKVQAPAEDPSKVILPTDPTVKGFMPAFVPLANDDGAEVMPLAEAVNQ